MRFKVIAIMFLILLTSCSVYRSKFDECPPGEGVPCTSVTEIEKMILETNEGPDIFLGENRTARCSAYFPYFCNGWEACQNKLWKCQSVGNCEDVRGEYVFLPLGED